jgi:predicted permease
VTAILDVPVEAAHLGRAALGVLTVMVVAFAGGALALRWLRWGPKRGFILTLVIVNSANIPFPLLQPNFGPEGLSLGIMCYITSNVVVFTFGIAWMSGRLRPDLLLKEPAFVATMIALLMKLASLRLPALVDQMAHLTAQGAIPAMLIILGQTLAGVRLGHVRMAIVGVGLRYLLGLLGGLLAVTVLGLSGLLRDIILFYSLLPSAVINVVLARRYGRDADLVATIVLLSTLVAVVLLPAVLLLLKSDLPGRIWTP